MLWFSGHRLLLTSGLLIGWFLPLTMLAQGQEQSQKTAVEYVVAGLTAQQAGNHDEALQHYSAALKLNPKDFAALFNSGASYMILRRFEDASPLSSLRQRLGLMTRTFSSRLAVRTPQPDEHWKQSTR